MNQSFEHIYEDEFCLIINKPSALSCEQLQTSFATPMLAVNRLDTRVSGLIVLAKHAQAAATFSALFQQRLVKKLYKAIVAIPKQPLNQEFELKHWLIRDGRHAKARVVNDKTKQAKQAISICKVLQTSNRYMKLEVHPITGRFHQIRCQLAAVGCHIVGDLKYGFPRNSADESIFLQSYALAFQHPLLKKPISLAIDEPEIWAKYGF